MIDNRNKDTAAAYFAEVLNRGDSACADRILADDVRFHYPLGDLNGSQEVKAYIQAVRTAFPDITFAVAGFITEGTQVSARWTLDGSQTGHFRGQPPSGRRVQVAGMTWFAIEDGKIREMWVSFDPARFVGESAAA